MTGTLNPGEYHPAADSAAKWLRSLSYHELSIWLESFSSCAIEANRLAELCAETLNRFITGEDVSDRYLLALAWTMRFKDE